MRATLSNFEACRAYSDTALDRLRQGLEAVLGRCDFLIGTNGSFARREASAQSDLDYFVLCRSEAQVAAVTAQMNAAKPTLLGIVPKPPASDGAFSTVDSLAAMLANIGGNDDDNRKFTRRMLFLLEGEWLYNPPLLEEFRAALVEKYVRDTLSEPQIALFLLNDIIRYYRTICVDFEFKTHEAGKDWGIRNIKLVFSRKLLYFSGVLAVAETYGLDAVAKRARLKALFALPVVERIRNICGAGADQALQLYDDFLGEFARPEVREACRQIREQTRGESPVFRRLKNHGHDFSRHLYALLQTSYPAGHPIHRALVL